MRHLPLDERGYPIPEFVDTVDDKRDFRFMSQVHWQHCVQQRRCWVCGGQLGARLCFVVGPMCLVNRTSSEPPSHRECGQWSARFCPFLSRPHMVRREDDLSRSVAGNVAGCPILRNPGAIACVIARSYQIFRDDKGAPLIMIGIPEEVTWWAEGRPATRAEVDESIRTGLPKLEEIAAQQKGGLEELARCRRAIEQWLPPEPIVVADLTLDE
jgi:hypothetical protein